MVKGQDRPRILVVDDDVTLLGLYVDVLKMEGYETKLARDGREAWAQLDPPPDLIVLDLMMPNMDGETFLRQLRGHPASAKIPVLVVSAVIPQAGVAHANAVLPKPFDLLGFLAAVKENLSEVAA